MRMVAVQPPAFPYDDRIEFVGRNAMRRLNAISRTAAVIIIGALLASGVQHTVNPDASGTTPFSLSDGVAQIVIGFYSS